MDVRSKKELEDVIKALSEEERKIVIDNLPVDEMLEGIKRNYVTLNDKYTKIADLIKN